MRVHFIAYNLADPNAKLGVEQYEAFNKCARPQFDALLENIVKQSRQQFKEDHADLFSKTKYFVIASILGLGTAHYLDLAGHKGFTEVFGIVGLLGVLGVVAPLLSYCPALGGHIRYIRHLKAYLKRQHEGASRSASYQDYIASNY